MEFFNNYINHYAESPNDVWRNLQQATITSLFEDTTIKRTILEEKVPFNQEYQEIEAWVGTVTDSTTNTEKDSNDYRALYFENCTHDVGRGLYYQYDNNYWLVYDSSTDLESISNVKIRRCNNRLKWIDKNSGELLDYPCIIEYTLSATQPGVTADITTIGGRVSIIVQGNEKTRKIKKNTRFIFGEQAYKFNNWNNYMMSDYDAKTATLLFMDFTVDNVQPTDDLENGIADSTEYKYMVKILEEDFSQIKGFAGKLNAIVILNGQEVERNIIWKSEDENIISVDNEGNYTLLGENGQSCKIYACIENSNVCSFITIEIEEEIIEKSDIVIDPLITEIPHLQVEVINANLYKNGVKQDDKVECIPSGLDNSYYYLVDMGNNQFKIANNKISKDVPLTLTFRCGDYEESIDIKLTPLF